MKRVKTLVLKHHTHLSTIWYDKGVNVRYFQLTSHTRMKTKLTVLRGPAFVDLFKVVQTLLTSSLTISDSESSCNTLWMYSDSRATYSYGIRSKRSQAMQLSCCMLNLANVTFYKRLYKASDEYQKFSEQFCSGLMKSVYLQ